ncbi:MAG: hypothetical protein M3Y80_04350 [Verrucomicrobiota bacterium]|nr:hypothetical protein [Verrucomicrobiota bacterium]
MRRSSLGAFVTLIALSSVHGADPEEEVLLEEVRVEAPFDVTIELPQERAVQEMQKRLELRAADARARVLEEANQNAVTRLLELTRYSPLHLGASDDKADAFFQQNYLRADLNPREAKNPLLGK